jgi:hypothetical protein
MSALYFMVASMLKALELSIVFVFVLNDVAKFCFLTLHSYISCTSISIERGFKARTSLLQVYKIVL